LWRDPDVKPGKLSNFPTAGFFPDIGTLFVRDSWKPDAIAAMFRCGPMGGYKLNEYRNSFNPYKYINVAHDDPDANSFIIAKGGAYLAETDRYSYRKRSSNHNTILINGVGQENPGRDEGANGMQWMQPATGNNSMMKQAVLTAYKRTPAITLVEGEARGSYPAKTGAKARPALDRYRRTFVWVRGDYILVLDDVRAPGPVAVTWLVQGKELKPIDEAAGIYLLSKNKASAEFRLLADAPLASKIGVSTANDHSDPLNWQQLQATAHADSVRFVSIFNPWHAADLAVTFQPDGLDGVSGPVASLKFDINVAVPMYNEKRLVYQYQADKDGNLIAIYEVEDDGFVPKPWGPTTPNN